LLVTSKNIFRDKKNIKLLLQAQWFSLQMSAKKIGIEAGESWKNLCCCVFREWVCALCCWL